MSLVGNPSSIKILHVDDEQDTLKFTKHFLQQNNPTIQITSTTSPIKALDLIETQQFDLILSDYRMPQMNGIDLAEKIRESSDIPFILYTGQGSEEVAEQAYQTGIDDYFKKEIDTSHYRVLARRIITVVDKTRAQKEATQTQTWLTAFMESATDGIELFDSEMNYVKVNKVILNRLGLSEEEVIGKHILEVRPHGKDSEEYKNLLNVLETGESYSRFVKVDALGVKNFQINVFKVLDGIGIISNDLSDIIESRESHNVRAFSTDNCGRKGSWCNQS